MINEIFVGLAFGVALLVCCISLYVSFIWLPRRMESAYENALRTLATAVETKDSRTLGHAERVADLVVSICRVLKLSGEEIRKARYAALLRDIGKAAVPHRILNKKEELTEGELRVVRNHVKDGADIVLQVGILAPLSKLIRHHHERWDGSGYPDGLAGEDIPLLSRIIGLVDDYEAMVSERPYHSPMSREEARRRITDGSGTLYDPMVVNAFLQVATAMEMTPPPVDSAAA